MKYILTDNGSLRPESVLNLRRVAASLSAASGLEVLPSSLLHSSKIPADQLEGEEAVNLERRIRLSIEAGERAFTLIPFFFGPTAAINSYLPERLAYRRQKQGEFHMERTPFLYEPGDASLLVDILAKRILQQIHYQQWRQPRVVLVDHGSPLPEVTAVRDSLAPLLADHLGSTVACVVPASMERRPGPEFAFNEPLLENLFDQPGWGEGPVVVSMLFLSPGRHAGPGGDIARICQAAEIRHPKLRTAMTGLVGDHPGIIPLLLRRLTKPRVLL